MDASPRPSDGRAAMHLVHGGQPRRGRSAKRRAACRRRDGIDPGCQRPSRKRQDLPLGHLVSPRRQASHFQMCRSAGSNLAGVTQKARSYDRAFFVVLAVSALGLGGAFAPGCALRARATAPLAAFGLPVVSPASQGVVAFRRRSSQHSRRMSSRFSRAHSTRRWRLSLRDVCCSPISAV